jgi:hypothetical protein
MEALIAEHRTNNPDELFPSTLDAPKGDEKVRGQLALFLVTVFELSQPHGIKG